MFGQGLQRVLRVSGADAGDGGGGRPGIAANYPPAAEAAAAIDLGSAVGVRAMTALARPITRSTAAIRRSPAVTIQLTASPSSVAIAAFAGPGQATDSSANCSHITIG